MRNMARLSHIEDFEERDEAPRGAAEKPAQESAAGEAGGAGRAADAAGEAGGAAASGEADAARRKAAEAAAARRKAAADKAAGAPPLQTASDERAYHGLDEGGMSGGQKFIAIVSFVVLVAVVLYILNYWFHFI